MSRIEPKIPQIPSAGNNSIDSSNLIAANSPKKVTGAIPEERQHSEKPPTDLEKEKLAEESQKKSLKIKVTAQGESDGGVTARAQAETKIISFGGGDSIEVKVDVQGYQDKSMTIKEELVTDPSTGLSLSSTGKLVVFVKSSDGKYRPQKYDVVTGTSTPWNTATDGTLVLKTRTVNKDHKVDLFALEIAYRFMGPNLKLILSIQKLTPVMREALIQSLTYGRKGMISSAINQDGDTANAIYSGIGGKWETKDQKTGLGLYVGGQVNQINQISAFFSILGNNQMIEWESSDGKKGKISVFAALEIANSKGIETFIDSTTATSQEKDISSGATIYMLGVNYSQESTIGKFILSLKAFNREASRDASPESANNMVGKTTTGGAAELEFTPEAAKWLSIGLLAQYVQTKVSPQSSTYAGSTTKDLTLGVAFNATIEHENHVITFFLRGLYHPDRAQRIAGYKYDSVSQTREDVYAGDKASIQLGVTYSIDVLKKDERNRYFDKVQNVEQEVQHIARSMHSNGGVEPEKKEAYATLRAEESKLAVTYKLVDEMMQTALSEISNEYKAKGMTLPKDKMELRKLVFARVNLRIDQLDKSLNGEVSLRSIIKDSLISYSRACDNLVSCISHSENSVDTRRALDAIMVKNTGIDPTQYRNELMEGLALYDQNSFTPDVFKDDSYGIKYQ